MTRGPESQAEVLAPAEFSRMARVATGNREADEILNGGFPTNSINVIMGEPGTGKTIFAQSLAWHNARGGRPVAYCTTLAEPLSKLVRYLQELDFFDSSLVGSSVFYDDLGDAVGRQGLEGLTQSLRELIKTRRPAILIVDSFKSAQDLGGYERDVRRMTFELAGLLSAYDVTTFLVGEYHEGDVRKSAVFAAADGIVELLRVADDRRDERYLRVLKLRGSDYLPGLHGFTITPGGLSIYPRRFAGDDEGDAGRPRGRVSTGVPGLDALTGGGIVEAGQTLLLGSPGAGKTTMAMQFLLDGARKGERGLFVGFQESEEQLERLIRRLDPGLATSERENLQILHRSSSEMAVDRFVGEVLGGSGRAKPKRVALDDIGELAAASSRRSHLDGAGRLLQAFSANGVTSILTADLELGRDAPTARMARLADNVIVAAECPGSPERLCIRVRKCRFSSHERSPRFLELGGRGARVAV